jgi:uncharacterized protein YjbI with pentapeptide repeats
LSSGNDDRRGDLMRIAMIVATICVVCVGAGAVRAADMTSRQVIAAIFKATAEAPVDFSDSDLSFLDLADVDFKQAQLTGADLFGCDLTGANFRGANLMETRLDRATIIRTDFSGANLEGATILRPSGFTSMEFDRSDAPKFTGARMAGVLIIARLDGASFRNADLTNANFAPIEQRADTLAALLKSQLTGVDFSGAKLSNAVFKRARMLFTRFNGADLKGTDFSEADLSRADFTGADLTGANFTNAKLDGAIFDNVVGLATVRGHLPTADAKTAESLNN